MSEHNSSPPRVAVYFRMSRDVQDKSIDRQRSEVLPHCQRQGYRIAAEHQDEGVSGSEVERCPGLQKLLALAKARQIDGVVVDDLDRLARLDLLELGVLLSPLRKAGVWVESCAQGRMDYNTMAGRIMLGIGGEAKRGEQLATARRVLTSHVERARDRRRPPQTKTAYGYRREPIAGTPLKSPPVIDEVTSEHVRSIFRWYVEGHSVGWIIRELYNRGVPSPRGKPRWSRPVVRELLRNPVYVGRRAWGKESTGRFFRQSGGVIRPHAGSRQHTRNRPDEWFTTDDTPALIDADLWDAAQRRLARRTPRTPTVEPGAFLLSGLPVCGRCGAPMTGVRKMRRNKRSRRGPVYICQGYVEHGTAVCVSAVAEEGWAVRQIITELRDRLLLPERLEWLTKRLAEQAREQRSQDGLKRMGKAVERLKARLDRERSRLMEVSKDLLPQAEAALRKTLAELGDAEKALREAQTADPVRDLKITAEAARQALWSLETALEGENRCLLKEALRGILAGVVIGAEPYQTTTGKTWHRARIDGIRLRPGSGLDVLSDLERTAEVSSKAPWRGRPRSASPSGPTRHRRR
jgi:DNA invertase Pin-like site-specific DNA recombinase